MRPIVTAYHRPRSRLLQRVTLLLALASGWGLPPGRAEASPAMQAAPSTCLPNAAKVVSPGVVLAGETATVTLAFSAACPGSGMPLHLVFVLDTSGSMAGERIEQLRTAVKGIVANLALAVEPSTKVGIVGFHSVATTFCPLTNDEGRIGACLAKLHADGGSNIDRGIVEGLKVLNEGRKPLDPDVEPNEVMVLVSDSPDIATCDPFKSAARRAKGQGVLLITACIGADCDIECMRALASSSRYAFAIDSALQLVDIFAGLWDRITGIQLRSLTITEKVPANMAFIQDSAKPPAELSPDHKTLRWELQGVAGTTRVSYRLRPLAAGSHPVSEGAVADFVDGLNRTGRAAFPIPQISVFGIARAGAAAPESLKLDGHLSAKAAKEGY